MNKPNGDKNVTFGDLKNILRDFQQYMNENISSAVGMMESIPYTGSVDGSNTLYTLSYPVVTGSIMPFYQGGKVDNAEFTATDTTVTFTFAPQSSSTLEFYAIRL